MWEQVEGCPYPIRSSCSIMAFAMASKALAVALPVVVAQMGAPASPPPRKRIGSILTGHGIGQFGKFPRSEHGDNFDDAGLDSIDDAIPALHDLAAVALPANDDTGAWKPLELKYRAREADGEPFRPTGRVFRDEVPHRLYLARRLGRPDDFHFDKDRFIPAMTSA
jgi:hypothetical protein